MKSYRWGPNPIGPVALQEEEDLPALPVPHALLLSRAPSLSPHMHAPGKGHVITHPDGGHVQAGRRALTRT